MTTHRRWILWGGATFGLALVGLGSYFAYIGLEQADKLASVLGFFMGSLGLAISILVALLPRSNNTPDNPPASGGTVPSTTLDGPSADSEPGNHLSNIQVHGPSAIINGNHGRQNNRFG
ncbi:hypothetical protein ACWGJT_26110 [Streptomyces xantholiticus]